MNKKLEDFTFGELQEHFTMIAHSGLLKSGGQGLKDAMFAITDQAIRWYKAQEAKPKKKGKK